MATQIFYKEGSKWIVNNDSVDAGACMVSETTNGLSISIKLVSNLVQLAYGAYTDFVDSSGTAYTKEEMLVLLDSFVNGSAGANGTPVIIEVELTRLANTTAYTANDEVSPTVTTPLPLEIENATDVVGGGGVLFNAKIESDMTGLAGKSLRLWFYNETPSGMVGDNLAMTSLYADKDIRLFYIDIIMDALLSGSDTIIGQVELCTEYDTASDDTSLYVVLQAIDGFTPTSEGKITVSLSTLKL